MADDDVGEAIKAAGVSNLLDSDSEDAQLAENELVGNKGRIHHMDVNINKRPIRNPSETSCAQIKTNTAWPKLRSW